MEICSCGEIAAFHVCGPCEIRGVQSNKQFFNNQMIKDILDKYLAYNMSVEIGRECFLEYLEKLARE